MRILLAEDDTVTLQMLGDALRKAGHVVLTAHDGDEALRLAADEAPDALVIDEKMPGRTGLDVARQLRGERLLPILLVTAYNDVETRAAAVEAGVHGFLVKPVSGDDVIAALEVATGVAAREGELLHDAEKARRMVEERKVIERAKGLLMKDRGLSEEDAYRRIQQCARSRNRSMADVARAILDADDVIAAGL